MKENEKWVEECENGFREKFFDIAEDIAARRGLRIVRLFGPTCSGKTTAAQILISLFGELGKRAHIVSIDDFFLSRPELLALSESKGLGTIDYDSPDTIDTEALRKFADEIFEADEVHCPIFDFKAGECVGYRSMKIDENDIFIFEGIQACYPSVIELLSEHGSASIYIAPQTSLYVGEVEILPNELRFMRRVVRDCKFRGSSIEFTSMLWESVRDNEEKNIFPYTKNCDYTVDSTMEYELGILKPYLTSIIEKMDRGDKHYHDALAILAKIESVEEIPSEVLREGMLYKEFV